MTPVDDPKCLINNGCTACHIAGVESSYHNEVRNYSSSTKSESSWSVHTVLVSVTVSRWLLCTTKY